MTWKKTVTCLAASLCLNGSNGYANVLQYFAGISYSNPAELFKIKKNELIIGGTGFYGDIKFTGSVLNFNTFEYDSGTSVSRRVSLLPYGRIATRINERLVFGVDVTEPFHSNLVWGDNALTRYASTETLMIDVDVSPRLSFSLNEKWYLGAGVNFNFLKNNETNWALPVNQTEYSSLINRTTGFGTGYNLGLYYVMNPTNFFGVTYYSSIRQNTSGQSIFNGQVNNDITFSFIMPSTSVANYVHIFNQQWLASVQVFRTEWNANQYARIFNTAAPPPFDSNFIFDMHYDPSWAFAAAVRNQVNKKTGMTLIAVQDNGPEQDRLRTINFPSDTQYLIGLQMDYHFNETASIELLYAHVFSKTLINNLIPINGESIPFTTGRVKINADVLDLKFKMQG